MNMNPSRTRPGSVETPTHVGIIMDGNGRWAKSRGLPRFEGHRRGVEAVRRTVRSAIEHGVRYLTIYSFSSENWRRPPDEVAMLMGLLKRYIRTDLADLNQNGVKVRVIGQREGLAPDIGALLDEAEALTRNNCGLNLVVAFNYGSRHEIVNAARRLAMDVREGRLDPAAIDEEEFAARLDTADIPDPDLIIRTSGEPGCRISCSGRRPTPNSSSCPSSGPISTMRPSPRPSSNMRRESAASARSRAARGHDRFVNAPMSASHGKTPGGPAGTNAGAALRTDLLPRAAAGAVMALAALAAAWFGGFVFVAFWWIAAAVVFWEWQRIMGGERLAARVALGAALLAAAALLAMHNAPVSAAAALIVGAVAVGLAAAPGERLWAAGAPSTPARSSSASVSSGRARHMDWRRSCGCSPSSGARTSPPISPAGRSADHGCGRASRRARPGRARSPARSPAPRSGSLALALVPGAIAVGAVFALGLAAAVVSEAGDCSNRRSSGVSG